MEKTKARTFEPLLLAIEPFLVNVTSPKGEKSLIVLELLSS